MPPQFNRTITNYQKAYRKKVDGLRAELKSSRSTADRLQARVDDLQSPLRVHLPSLLLGAAVAAAGRLLLTRLRRPGQGAAGAPKATEAADGGETAATPAAGQQ